MAHAGTNAPFHASAPAGTSLFKRLGLGFAAARQRRHLAELDDAMLRDIGLSREAAEEEARRSVWDVPPSWLR
jgi:hypothetical protein